MFFTYAPIPNNVMMYRIRIFICKGLFAVLGYVRISCANNSASGNEESDNNLTGLQEQLISEGWHFPNLIAQENCLTSLV